MAGWPSAHTIASGATHAPVAPRNLACEMTSRNSCTRSRATSVQAEVLHDHHPVADVERLRDHERLAVVFRRVGAEAPGVTPGQRHPVIGEPPAKRHARTWFARGVPLVVGSPQTAPAGVEEHRVAGPDIVAGDGESATPRPPP